MIRLLPFALLSALVGCSASERDPEAWDDWYGPMGALDEDVTEEVLFMDEPTGYTDDDYTGGVAGLDPLFEGFTRKFAPGDDAPGGCDGWEVDNSLPREFWAMVTLHPRLYYKGEGCQPNENDRPHPQRDEVGSRLQSEEKYYGNFFIEDDSGGVFVQNDSKVAHFKMGDRVRVRIRGVGERFDLQSVVSHDILEVDRGPYPMAWTHAGDTTCSGIPADFDSNDAADLADLAGRDVECAYDDGALVGRMLRATGKVLTLPDTFGGFLLEDDDGFVHQLTLDSELNRRKWSFPIGSRIQATGPVLNSFGNPIVIMKVGQVEVLSR